MHFQIAYYFKLWVEKKKAIEKDHNQIHQSGSETALSIACGHAAKKN